MAIPLPGTAVAVSVGRGPVAQTYLERRYQPTHHFRNFTLVVLLAVLTFIVGLVLVAHDGPLR